MKMIQATFITTALLATGPLFANTSVNATAEIKTEQSGLLSNLSHGVKNTAQKVGQSVQGTAHTAGQGIQKTTVTVDHLADKGLNKTLSVSENALENAKVFTAATSQVVETKSQKVKDVAVKNADKAKTYTTGKWQQSKAANASHSSHAQVDAKANVALNAPVAKAKEATVKKADQTKKYAAEKWQKTKAVAGSHSGHAHVDGKTHVELNTPVAKANVGVSTAVGIGHSK